MWNSKGKDNFKAKYIFYLCKKQLPDFFLVNYTGSLIRGPAVRKGRAAIAGFDGGRRLRGGVTTSKYLFPHFETNIIFASLQAH
ncbi:MAG: hypothetical protein RLY31_562 [Bacteroidota bacterium]|jgi:hypothetical protein